MSRISKVLEGFADDLDLARDEMKAGRNEYAAVLMALVSNSLRNLARKLG